MQAAQLINIQPPSGTPAGGEQVTLTGMDLENTIHVNWGDKEIPNSQLTVARDGSKITFQAPAGAPNTEIFVSATTADSGTTNELGFLYDGSRRA